MGELQEKIPLYDQVQKKSDHSSSSGKMEKAIEVIF